MPNVVTLAYVCSCTWQGRVSVPGGVIRQGGWGYVKGHNIYFHFHNIIKPFQLQSTSGQQRNNAFFCQLPVTAYQSK